MSMWDAKTKQVNWPEGDFVLVTIDTHPMVLRVPTLRQARQVGDVCCSDNPFMVAYIMYPQGVRERSRNDYANRKISWDPVEIPQVPNTVKLATVIA